MGGERDGNHAGNEGTRAASSGGGAAPAGARCPPLEMDREPHRRACDRALLALLSLVLLGGGGTALWADRTQRDAGYVTTDVHKFSTSGSALATVSTELGSAGVGWLYSPGLMDKVRLRITPTSPHRALFVGIGPSTDVDRYLAGVRHTVISEFWGDKTEAVDGGTPSSPPGAQNFWVASSTGAGPQTVVWDPTDGSWTVVVMNADGRPGIAVDADLGARIPAVLWIAIGLLAGGAVFLVGGGLLIAGAFPRRHTATTQRKGGVMSTPTVAMPVPRGLSSLDEAVDRYEGIRQYSLPQSLRSGPPRLCRWAFSRGSSRHKSRTASAAPATCRCSRPCCWS